MGCSSNGEVMVTEFFPFQFEINPIAIAGSALWATGIYLGFSPTSDWMAERLSHWFAFAERPLFSQEEYDRTRAAREAVNELWGSIFSIIPFLLLGTLCYYGCLLSLGNQSWGISLGIIAFISGGVYDLGRRADTPEP